ncbi:LPS-assembly protein LptD [Desulfosarcina sp.]|uniref:LPS-assembly protein LptD n=1 Tax=Desulfosarcina sp. TaxID=2027861 RepID=UPI0029A8EDB0|nr:LPS assembly protein LptD [Desulfosarcina sp.]MDX2455624.1 LPS assembly protein LptD [Desulfosarcina sp.]MDX2493097.1 LPS assembly protein LptD [Desulfosarcina sp.]
MILTFLFLTFGFLTPWVPRAHAQSITDRLSGSPKVPWQISADTVDYDAASTTYHARGNVIIEKQATRLVADSVSFNQKAMTAVADGHVVMTVGDDILTGGRVELNLDQETGVVHDGTVFLKENHFYIHGERIEKTGKDTYRAEKGSITSCDGDQPDWVITGRKLKVTIDGYGTATHAVLRARDVPVLYTPYLLFPAKTKRQTGLLLPEAGVSTRWGFNWDQPLFWAISDNTDATLYTQYMQKRGTKIGLEYRYALTDRSFGAIKADGLQDRQVDDGTPEETQQWGYPGDAYDRPNTDRYWLRAKVDQELPWGAKAQLDLDIVSDQDYLTEWKDGYSGFNETRDYFLEAFGRDLDPYDENTRTNRLNVNRNWSRYSLNGSLLWNDNVIKRRWEETDDTLQQLPVIEFDSVKQQAFGTGVYWDLDSEYTYYYREDGDQGHRTDLYPRAYLPLKWKNYLSVEPSVGWRQTAWVMDRQEDDSLDRSTYRQIYDARLDLSTEFSRIMGSPVGSIDRIRHRIKPRVVYEYIPDQDQSDLPFFTDLDRIGEKNLVTYSLTNTFTSRTATAVRPTPATGVGSIFAKKNRLTDRVQASPSGLVPFDYHRFCRFYVEQSYDITAARNDRPEPFSDIFGELEFNFGRYLYVDSNSSYNTYDNNFSSHSIGAAIADRRGDRLLMTHSYKKDDYESISGALSVKLTSRLTVRGEYERNLQTQRDISKGIGFLYKAQCWAVDFFYGREGEDNQFLFSIDLMGIGGFGE